MKIITSIKYYKSTKHNKKHLIVSYVIIITVSLGYGTILRVCRRLELVLVI